MSLKHYTEDDPNVTILDPNVIVFHNVLSDPDEYIDFNEENLNWRGWYGFGRQVDHPGLNIQRNPHIPTKEEIDSRLDADEKALEDIYLREISYEFISATDFYVRYTGIDLPNWSVQPWGLARYIPDENLINHDKLTMNYHTDYVVKEQDVPGDKFAITAVIYANDDYEGGEISFRVIGDGGIEKEFDYKPKAGDMVMFPAKHPYYHGVKRIYGAPKYITRLYWSYYYEGSDSWHRLKAKYGEKFEELERERFNRNDLLIAAPYLRQRMSMDTYYELLDAGELLDDYTQTDVGE